MAGTRGESCLPVDDSMKEWEQVACHDLLLVARDPPFLLVLQPMRCKGKLFLSGSFLAHCLGADCSFLAHCLGADWAIPPSGHKEPTSTLPAHHREAHPAKAPLELLHFGELLTCTSLCRSGFSFMGFVNACGFPVDHHRLTAFPPATSLKSDYAWGDRGPHADEKAAGQCPTKPHRGPQQPRIPPHA